MTWRASSITGDDERALIRSWQRGFVEAGEVLLRRHRPGVHAFFARKAPDHADDLTQRTLLKCVEVRGRVDPTRGLSGYLYGIARKVLCEHRRRSTQRAEHHMRWLDAEDPLGMVLLEDAGHADSILALGEIARVVERLLAELPVYFRRVVELYYWQSMSIEEIAGELGVAPGTVKSRLARGRVMLQRSIELRSARGELDPKTLREA